MSLADPAQPPTVRRMFDRIARRYDLLNHLLSANLDRLWRRAAAAETAGAAGLRALDLCGGTGDMTLALLRTGRFDVVLCCDFAHEMLARAAEKFRRRRVSGRCPLVEADALRLPFAGASFDVVTIAFGVRNLADARAGFREMRRVLVPGGRLVVLEFSTPTAAGLRSPYRWYLSRLLPRIGDGLSGAAGPYGYLSRTISTFPEPPVLAGWIREAGFAACGWRTKSGGIVAIHTAING